jgi:hypothetical protein
MKSWCWSKNWIFGWRCVSSQLLQVRHKSFSEIKENNEGRRTDYKAKANHANPNSIKFLPSGFESRD